MGVHMQDFSKCPCSGSTLGRMLHATILAALARGPLHGYAVGEYLSGLKMFREQRPDPAGVYRILRSLEKSGFISGKWDLAGSGPRRRIYYVTPEGVGCLARWQKTLMAYRAGIDEIINTVNEGVVIHENELGKNDVGTVD